MIAAAVVGLMVAACIGWGTLLLRSAGVFATLSRSERIAWAFALGVGALGWIVFPLALVTVNTGVLLAVLLLPALLLLVSGQGASLVPAPPAGASLDAATAFLLMVAAAVMIGDFAEALSPPADADSTAYHFATPALFLEAGRVFFIPRATDGAAPLLPHMTYMVALALGGERALTLWCAVSGWAAAALSYTSARRSLPRHWSLVIAVIVLTLPAMLYGGGTGQVEPRIVLFVLVAGFAAADALQRQSLGAAALAGLAAGFYAGSKYFGLIFIAAVGLTLLIRRRPSLPLLLTFTAAASLAGGQWYLWNWWHTGDPLFPALFGHVAYVAGTPWSAAQQAYFLDVFQGREWAVPANLFWLLAYPVAATLAPFGEFDAGRVGLGPYLLLVLPLAVAGVWAGRGVLGRSALLTVAIILVLSYALWFFASPSQRVRHLLPLVPLAVIVLTVAAERATRTWSVLRAPLIAAVAFTLLLQASAQGLYVMNHLRHLVSGENRDAFLLRNVSEFAVAQAINSALGKENRVLLINRQLNYFLEVPYFYGHPQGEARIELRADSVDPELFRKQLAAQGVTHILTPLRNSGAAGSGPEGGIDILSAELIERGCAIMRQEIDSRRVTSRSLAVKEEDFEIKSKFYLLELTPSRC